jgi:nitrite reductase (NO-forming)
MTTSLTQPRANIRPALAVLGKVTLAALIGISLIIVYAMLFITHHIDPLALGFALIALLCAGIVAVGWRWAPLLGTLLSGLMLASYIPLLGYILAHPDEPNFVTAALFLPVSVVGIAAGVGATVQNYRDRERRAPRWLAAGLAALAGWTVGALVIGALIAAVPKAGSSVGISPGTLAGLPALAAQNTKFDQSELHAKVGETLALRLENRDNLSHSFDIDAFNLHVPLPANQSGAAVFKPTQAGTYTFYCSLPGHREAGMVGTLIVEP